MIRSDGASEPFDQALVDREAGRAAELS